jgi:hypothetical protein
LADPHTLLIKLILVASAEYAVATVLKHYAMMIQRGSGDKAPHILTTTLEGDKQSVLIWLLYSWRKSPHGKISSTLTTSNKKHTIFFSTECVTENNFFKKFGTVINQQKIRHVTCTFCYQVFPLPVSAERSLDVSILCRATV